MPTRLIYMLKKAIEILRTELFLLKMLVETDGFLGGIFLLITCIQYVIPIIDLWLWKLIIDELAMIFLLQTVTSKIWLFLSLFLFLQVSVSLIEQVTHVVYEKIQRKASHKLDIAIMEKLANVDAIFYDDPENSNKLIAARTSEVYITNNMHWMIETIVRSLSLISVLYILLSYDFCLGSLFIFTYIPGAILLSIHKSKVDKWSIYNIPESRKKDYYKSLLIGDYAAKELRLYNLAEYFTEKFNCLWQKIRTERERQHIHTLIISIFSVLLTYVGFIILIISSIRSVLLGHLGVGTLVFYVTLAQNAGENFRLLINDILVQAKIVVPHISLYMEFINYKNKVKDDGTNIISQCPSIEFCNVSFKYPGNESFALKDLSFRIERGEKIAFVGINGAGKTTIIMLLLRFYEPDSGKILLDGKNIQEYKITEVLRLFSVCFQEINKYSFTLRDNIALSNISRRNEIDLIKNAAQASGVDKIIDSLEIGFESDMTRRFNDNGINLSDGQWQKIALARTFFRESYIVILDEPTSSLDPEAEEALFSSFTQLCKDKSGILISHRLSSTILVDKIMLLEDGAIVEKGTHQELMNLNGKYAEMYRLQSNKYKDDLD